MSRRTSIDCPAYKLKKHSRRDVGTSGRRDVGQKFNFGAELRELTASTEAFWLLIKRYLINAIDFRDS